MREISRRGVLKGIAAIFAGAVLPGCAATTPKSPTTPQAGTFRIKTADELAAEVMAGNVGPAPVETTPPAPQQPFTAAAATPATPQRKLEDMPVYQLLTLNLTLNALTAKLLRLDTPLETLDVRAAIGGIVNDLDPNKCFRQLGRKIKGNDAEFETLVSDQASYLKVEGDTADDRKKVIKEINRKFKEKKYPAEYKELLKPSGSAPASAPAASVAQKATETPAVTTETTNFLGEGKIKDTGPISQETLGHIQKKKYAALVVDAETGEVLIAHNAQNKLVPASMVKMMTLYIAHHMVANGQLKMDDTCIVGPHIPAADKTQQGNKMGLKAGQGVKVRDLLGAISVYSANDAASVLAEHIAGSEEKFAEMMNQYAETLGMKDTTFTDASGYDSVKQRSTAQDMIKLLSAVYTYFPDACKTLDKESYKWKDGDRTFETHNSVRGNILDMFASCGKTGSLNAAGKNLVTTATRNGRIVYAVIFGAATLDDREYEMRKLLDDGLAIAEDRAAGKKPAPKKAAANDWR